jgi:hypothetical protein
LSAARSVCQARDFNVYFESWQAELSAAARTEIAAVQSALGGCRIGKVRIVGMAGAPGDEAANIEVSRRRAEAIAAALEAGGWPRSNFEIIVEVVFFLSGNQDVPVRAIIGDGQCTRDIDIGGPRNTSLVNLTYETFSLGRGMATVQVYAQR